MYCNDCGDFTEIFTSMKFRYNYLLKFLLPYNIYHNWDYEIPPAIE